MTDLFWHRFGNVTSTNDVDLVLAGDDAPSVAARIDTLADIRIGHPWWAEESFAITWPTWVLSAYLPQRLVDEAITLGRREGLPLDLFLSCGRGRGFDFAVAAWIAPPFDVVEVGYRGVGEDFMWETRSGVGGPEHRAREYARAWDIPIGADILVALFQVPVCLARAIVAEEQPWAADFDLTEHRRTVRARIAEVSAT